MDSLGFMWKNISASGTVCTGAASGMGGLVGAMLIRDDCWPCDVASIAVNP